MRAKMIELRVRGIAIIRDGAASLVVLEDFTTGRKVGVPVGPSEAGTVILELEGVSPSKPRTHDILVSMFRDHGFRFDRAELRDDGPLGIPGIDDNGGRYLARIVYRQGLRTWKRDVRPSDAIALALKLKAPIVAPEALVEKSPWPAESGRSVGRDAVWYYLESRESPRVMA
ncbi:MAG: DUF151 domain-containing protein [Spirochaetes bacterium]|nr:DUF151 domain-containing protein [Spirochaetota bacterium]